MPESFLETLLQQSEFSRKSRIPSLFSDFSPLSQSNKDGFEANLQAWQSALAKTVFTSPSIESHLSIDANEALAAALASHQWGRPLALPTIESEARQRRVWIPLDVFMALPTSIYTQNTGGLSASFAGLLKWGWSKVYTLATPTTLSGTTYVLVQNLERLVKAIERVRQTDSASQYSDSVMTRALFAQWVHEKVNVKLSASDITLLLQYLQRDKNVLRYQDATIKWSTAPMTEPDVAVASLKETIAHLAQQMEHLNHSLEDLAGSLKHQLHSKGLAMSTLRRRKGVEKRLDETSQRHAECVGLLARIDQGTSQVRVLEDLQRGSAALGHVLQQIGGVERVERVIEQVREQEEQVEELGRAMAATSLDDKDDVDEEYAALLEASKRVEATDSIDLPVETDAATSLTRPAESVTAAAEKVVEKEGPDDKDAETTANEREAILA